MEDVLRFIRDESSAPKGKIVFMSTLSGLASALLLAIINIAAGQVSDSKIEVQYFVMYLAGLLLYIYAQRYALIETAIAVEDAIRKIRLRVANKIRHADLRFIEEMDHARLYRPFTQEGAQISMVATVIVMAAQSVVLLVAVSVYLFYLSPLSLFMVVIFLALAMLYNLYHKKQMIRDMQTSFRNESKLFTTISHILSGFKELKINKEKNDGVYHSIKKIATEGRRLKIKTNTQLILQITYSQVAFYTLLLIVVFILPIFDEAHRDIIFKMSATVLFIMGPVTQLVGAIPSLTQTNISIGNIYRLEEKLDAMHQSTADDLPVTHYADFHEIKLNQMRFDYKDSDGLCLFSAGPFDLVIPRGEILFIVGGNGSGKSTFLKLLCGLYYPASGNVQVDNKLVNYASYQSYRNLFSIIFTDFYLFDRLYGLKNIDEDRLNELLRMMQLDDKTSYVDGRFTNVDLSTGQKKRLAFIVSILENKPVCILDELAADQDPEFRRYFYEEILPDLKKEGRTIIAVTHDDKYFHCADRILKMDYGEIISDESS